MSYGYSNYGYNPIQNRMDSLIQQKNMIDQQLNSLQQMNVPPININNNLPANNQQQNNHNFDFNGKWVNGEEQAKSIAGNNLPLILFDNNKPLFYMKDLNGSFKTFKFEEVVPVETNKNNEMDIKITQLENKLDNLINALSGTQQQNKPQQTPQEIKKEEKKKGDK